MGNKQSGLDRALLYSTQSKMLLQQHWREACIPSFEFKYKRSFARLKDSVSDQDNMTEIVSQMFDSTLTSRTLAKSSSSPLQDLTNINQSQQTEVFPTVWDEHLLISV